MFYSMESIQLIQTDGGLNGKLLYVYCIDETSAVIPLPSAPAIALNVNVGHMADEKNMSIRRKAFFLNTIIKQFAKTRSPALIRVLNSCNLKVSYCTTSHYWYVILKSSSDYKEIHVNVLIF